MTISTIQILAATDWEDVIKVLAAVAVLAGGAVASYFKNNSDSQSSPVDEDSAPEAAKPRRQPQYPTAQPMPDHSQPRPVIIQRQEEPARPVVTRPTAPPVIAESPIPTIRRTPPPAQRPTAQPASRVDRPVQSQKRRVAPQSKSRPETVAQPLRTSETGIAATTEKRPRVRPTLAAQLSSQSTSEPRSARTEKVSLRLVSKENLRNAFLLSEIIGPPLALRPIDEPRW